jgi:hypothetical protein
VRDVARGATGVLLLLALAGCGGSSGSSGAAASPEASAADLSGQAAASVTAPSADASAAAAAAKAAAQAAPGTAQSGGSVSVSGGGAAAAKSPQPGAQPTPTHIILDATLSSACVTPGGSMTLTIEHARPGMQVIFDTTYSDGQDGKVHGGIDSKGTRTTTSGGYRFTWTVDPLTPKGQATVQVGAVDSMGYGDRKLTFDVAPSC